MVTRWHKFFQLGACLGRFGTGWLDAIKVLATEGKLKLVYYDEAGQVLLAAVLHLDSPGAS